MVDTIGSKSIAETHVGSNPTGSTSIYLNLERVKMDYIYRLMARDSGGFGPDRLHSLHKTAEGAVNQIPERYRSDTHIVGRSENDKYVVASFLYYYVDKVALLD